MNTLIIILIAVLPALALMIFIFFQDNHEREPIGLLLKIFLLGILSVLPVLLFEFIADFLLKLIFGGLGAVPYYAIEAFFGVAIIEEFFKFLAAYLLTWRNKHFNYKFDGIVYCLFGSMGFAATENIMYLLTNSNSAVTLGIQRGLLAIPAHAMCAIFMGYYYGNAKYQKSYGNRIAGRRNLLIGFLIASSLHAFYDFCLFTNMGIFFLLFAIFVVVADILTIIRIVKARKENEKMYEAPQYRQYWVNSNPYQPYGGYAAPVYGGYSYANASGNVNGQVAPFAPPASPAPTYAQNSVSPYAPQGGAAPSYAPQGSNTPPVVATGQQYNPEIVSQGTSYTPSAQNQSSTQVPPTQAQGNTYVPPAQGQGSAYAPPAQGQGSAYAPPAQGQDTTYAPNGLQQSNVQAPPEQQPKAPAAQPAAPVIPPVRMMQIHCPVCSTINNFNAFYCTNCGSSLHQL